MGCMFNVLLVAAGSLGTVGTAATGIKNEPTEVKSDVKEEPAMSDSELTLSDKDVQPVGQDYIEEIKNDEGELGYCDLYVPSRKLGLLKVR